MDTKNIVIIILAILVVVLAIACGCFVLNHDSNDKQVNATNNVTNESVANESSGNTQVPTISKDSDKSASSSSSSDSSSSSSDSSRDSSSQKQYDDWQQDYETGEYDENGNPIYRSVISTSGGQYEPGVYESYWSSSGPISEERIG